jgi:hypothetical protein
LAVTLIGGAFNRVLRLVPGDGECRAILQDDFHHFRIVVGHAGGRVTVIRAETKRGPYSLCPAAGQALSALVGTPLTLRAGEVLGGIDSRMQCTHQLDLAAFAIAAAARGRAREYGVTVPDLVNGTTRATVMRDGAEVLAWTVRDYAVVDPEPFAGRSLGEGFSNWVAHTLEGDCAEAALVLRRAVFVSRGRAMLHELNREPHARPTGNCWVQQPGRAELASRDTTGVRDHSTSGVPLDADDAAWLAATPAGREPGEVR